MRLGNLIRGPKGLRIAVDDDGTKPGRVCTLSFRERIPIDTTIAPPVYQKTFSTWVAIDARLSPAAARQLRDQLNKFLGEQP